MGEWARTAGSPPQWTMETKLKMNEIYALLERRVEKCAQYVRSLSLTRRLTKLERADHALDFATEFTSLTSAVLGLFAPGSLSIVDLQREFELSAHDEELCNMAEEGENGKEGENAKEEEDVAVITSVDAPAEAEQAEQAKPAEQAAQGLQASQTSQTVQVVHLSQTAQSPQRDAHRETEVETGKTNATVIEDVGVESPKKNTPISPKSVRVASQSDGVIHNLKGIAVVWV